MTDDSIQIAFDAGPLYGHRTGVGVAVAGMEEALRQRPGVEVSPYLVSARSKPAAGHRRLPLPGIAASHLWARSGFPAADRWLGRADVVHGTNYVAPPTSLPTVVSVYDCWFLRHPDQATPLVRRAGRTLRRRVAEGAWVHVSSDATAHVARQLLDTDRIVTVHLGPPPTPPAEHVSETPPGDLAELRGVRYIVAIGTEERRKNLPMLVAAFSELAASEEDVRLVLAGAPGDQTADVDAAIDELDDRTAGRVHRLGVIDTTTKSWLLRHAAVLAYPSLDEGFGFPVLEAQAAAVPVVASDVGSVGEVAGAGAVLVADPAPSAFAAALHKVVLGEISRLELITSGHENVQRFSWNATADGLVDIYRRALDA